ncbi:MAG: TOMM precursor leader peptide-binding protein [Marmoricola sp.]
MELFERRARLAAGLRVVRRGRDHLQIGLYDERRVLLPRTQDVEQVLAALAEGAPVGNDPDHASVLEGLQRTGCVVWDQPPRAVRPAVAVLGRLEVPGLPDLDGLLRASGVAVTPSIDSAQVVLVLSVGELDRDRLDPLIRSRTAHLVVRLVDGGAVIGPFVAPGATACLRCIDAHLSVRDPDHVAVTARYVRATARPRADGMPDLDPALTSLTLVWALRDVVAHLAGAEPSSWSRTVHLGPDPSQHASHTWLRHPQCGCCWPVDVGAAGEGGNSRVWAV